VLKRHSTEVTVLKPDMIDPRICRFQANPAEIMLHGAFGDCVLAKLYNVSAQLLDVSHINKRHTVIELTCAELTN
jgi:hypothetical protein